ncbi:MAG: type I glyceraldehyde-3-phosphate dehydrogenase [Legionellales bacterium]|nr:MAG: type I glyceraldehyde-3-phosphate dehydrogenase [Legionellales bacterium]
MTIKVAINGFGRIGRNIARALYESGRNKEIELVAINDLGDANTNAHLLKYDSTHGIFAENIKVENNHIIINDARVQVLQERDPCNLPWGKLGIDVVLECTGIFANKTKAMAHIKAGAKKVLISAPAGNDIDATIVYGVNHHTLKPEHLVVSNASCTTNCLAPLVKPLNDAIGIESGLMTTIHAFTNDQVLNDVYHTDVRRARSAVSSMIPTNTGAAAAVGLVLPELQGKLDGFAMRVPTMNVSVVDLSFIASKKTSVAEVNDIVVQAANNELKGVLAINTQPLVSIDFNHNPASSIFDVSQTKVMGNLVKVLAWYDNEWGFANRMLDTTVVMAGY